ncbi:HAD family hydrolase [Clostridium acetobutylicum]|nr:HAD family hydrolase [Clostridium acetobutylicum]
MIKAILMDSGKVLNKPATGEWFIPPKFFYYVDWERFNTIPLIKRKSAFDKANKYIKEQKLITTEEEEYKCFLEYYKILSKELYQLKLKNNDIEEITEDLVYNYRKYDFYKDAIYEIPKLSKKYKLAVISDAWPSLEGVFKKAGLRRYFSSFVISSVKGVTKPNEMMYKTALSELRVLPEEAVFIDDNIKNCEGAVKLGIKSFVLSRKSRIYAYNKLFNRRIKSIRSLKQLEEIV